MPVANNIEVIGGYGDRLRVYLPETKESRRGIPASRKIYFIILGEDPDALGVAN